MPVTAWESIGQYVVPLTTALISGLGSVYFLKYRKRKNDFNVVNEGLSTIKNLYGEVEHLHREHLSLRQELRDQDEQLSDVKRQLSDCEDRVNDLKNK